MARFIKLNAERRKVSLWCVKSASFALVNAAFLFAHNARAQSPIDAHTHTPDVQMLTKQTPYQWFASTDPKRQNQDYLLLKPNETRRIPLADGTFLRLWFTSSNPEKCEVSLQNGAQNVVLLRDGKAQLGKLWNKAWLLYPSQNAASSTRLATLAANATLVVTNRDQEAMKFFYQAAVRPGSGVPLKKSKGSSGLGEGGMSVRATTVKAGQSFTIFSKKSGPGNIFEVSVSLVAPSVQALRDLRLVARFDTAATNAATKQIVNDVDVSLIALIAQNSSALPMKNALCSFDGKRLILHASMPYSQGVLLSILNSGQKSQTFNYRYVETVAAPGQSSSIPDYRFHALCGSARTENNKPIPILRATGEGAFVGLNLDMRPVAGSTRRTFVFLEGNEVIEADSVKHEGTGNEDFFNSAWYFPDQPFSRSFNGLTNKTQSPPTVSAYRLMIPDAVPFKKNFAFDFGHSGRNRGDDMEYRWVAFWYQKPGGSWQIQDKLAATSVKNAEAKNAAANGRSRSTLYLALVVALGGALAAFQMSARRNRRKSPTK